MKLVYQNKSVWNSMQIHTACDSSHKGKCWLLLLIGISLVTAGRWLLKYENNMNKMTRKQEVQFKFYSL